MNTVLVYGGPTTGKSTVADELVKDGISVLDTDLLIEAICSGELGLAPNDWEKAWDFWKSEATPEFKEKGVKTALNLVNKLRFKYPNQPLVILTNLHTPDLKPDLAYFREPADTLELMEKRAVAKGRALSPSYQQEILSWGVPAVGTPMKTLSKEQFIRKEDIITKLGISGAKAPEVVTTKEDMAKAMSEDF